MISAAHVTTSTLQWYPNRISSPSEAPWRLTGSDRRGRHRCTTARKARRSSSTGWPALTEHDGYRGCIVAQMPAGKSRDFVEQAAQHAVSIRRAMSNNRFQKALVAELEAL